MRKSLKINPHPELFGGSSLIKLMPTSALIRSPLTASPFGLTKRPLAEHTPTMRAFDLGADAPDKSSQDESEKAQKEPTSLTFSQLKIVLKETSSPTKVNQTIAKPSVAPAKASQESSSCKHKSNLKAKATSFKMRRFEPDSDASLECSESNIEVKAPV